MIYSIAKVEQTHQKFLMALDWDSAVEATARDLCGEVSLVNEALGGVEAKALHELIALGQEIQMEGVL